MKKNIVFIITRVITAGLLFWAISYHPYSYYNLLRIIVCAVSIYGLINYVKMKNKLFAWIFGVMAFIFNPIIPVYLDKGLWQVIDVICGVILLISIFFIKGDEDGVQNEE